VTTLTAISYVYGRGEMSVEQINNTTGAVEYLHHDQQDSTRLLTGATGKVEGKCSYSAYGVPTCEGTATTLSRTSFGGDWDLPLV
jgi:hypothetical protein